MQRPLSFPCLRLTLPTEDVNGFASLFQHGILIPVDQPAALIPLLLALPGFTAAYIENTVQTIFINGVAADSLERSLPAGSILALSAAMPGLAGAIFRRQGVHGSLRSQPVAKAQPTAPARGFITLKLFNSIAVDRIDDLLPGGILITGKAFHDFAARHEHLFQPPAELSLVDQTLDYTQLLPAVAGIPVLRVIADLLPQD